MAKDDKGLCPNIKVRVGGETRGSRTPFRLDSGSPRPGRAPAEPVRGWRPIPPVGRERPKIHVRRATFLHLYCTYGGRGPSRLCESSA